MTDGYLKFSCHTPSAIVLDRFSGVSDPTVWVYQAERYFNFYGFSKDIWLSLPYLYFDGETLTWFNWLYRNKQFYDWKHFTDKLACQYRRQIVTKLGLSPVADLLLQIDANFSCMSRHLDNIQNTLSACYQKFSDAQARPDLTASLADKCVKEEVVPQEIGYALNEDNLNTPENSEICHPMLGLQVANSKVLPKLLNSRSSSSTSIPFPSLEISFGCIRTLGPMLDSKYDLKNDPSSYAYKVFAEIPEKKLDMEVEHPVINDSANLASHMFDENFQTVSTFKGEYGDLIMFDDNFLALPCLPSVFSRTQLMGRSIFDYFREFNHANLPLSLYRFPPDQFVFRFLFDPGSSLLLVFFSTANYYFRMVVDIFKEIIRIFTCHINSTFNAYCILPQFLFDPGANLFIISPDTLQLQRLISLRFGSMRGANAISSFFLVSRVKLSEAELDNYGQLFFSLLLLVVVKKVFQQQLDFKVLTTCSPEMVEYIQFELLSDYWIKYFRNPTSDVFDDALVVALYHNILDVVGQIHRDRSAQILQGMNILNCIWNLSKLVVSINDPKNVDTPLVSQRAILHQKGIRSC